MFIVHFNVIIAVSWKYLTVELRSQLNFSNYYINNMNLLYIFFNNTIINIFFYLKMFEFFKK